MNKKCLKIVSTVAITVPHLVFQKIFVVACPRTPLKPFLFLILLQINSICYCHTPKVSVAKKIVSKILTLVWKIFFVPHAFNLC